MKPAFVIILTLLLSVGAIAQDSTFVDSSAIDSTLPLPAEDTTTAPPPIDESAPQTLEDSMRVAFPGIDPDTLTDTQRLGVAFEMRLRLHRKDRPVVKAEAPFSYFDSLAVWFIPERWNMREGIDRTFYHDAGHYFKLNTGYVVREHQTTPMRTTVQPYGLAGDRLGVMVNDNQLTPFEHIIEPDGLMDLNDIPTALDHTVAILPGPAGMVFGGKHSVATLLTVPKPKDSSHSESTFLVDKGSFGFSYARARYSKRFLSGKEIDMSIGYRNADGATYGRDDFAYHYTGDFYLPWGDHKAIRATGCLYDRKGTFRIRPDAGGERVDRDRFDRLAKISFVKHNEEYTGRQEIGYKHIRQASSLDDDYVARLNVTVNGLFASREWIAEQTIVQAKLALDHNEYDDWWDIHNRYEALASFSLARMSDQYRLALNVKGEYVESQKFLPSASVMVQRESDKMLFVTSVGYSERAPSLHEMYLRYQEANIYGSYNDYADHGNSNLKPERQLIGSTELELGSRTTNVGLEITGGKIFDGIDWNPEYDGNTAVFSPRNGDVDFANFTLDGSLGLSDYLKLKAGGSYHYVEYALYEDKPYTPVLQTFSGVEFHLYWPQKLLDFWAYVEMMYTSEYDGYEKSGLGNDPVFNVKMSVKMGSFRFHWISQNTLSREYSARESFVTPGRYNTYGFTWDFLD